MDAFSLLVVVLLLLCACQTESYESGDMVYSNLQADFAEAYSREAETLVSMMTDDGDSLTLLTDKTFKWASTPDSTYRTLIYYNKVSAREGEVVSVRLVPTATIVPTYTVKEMKTDPLTLASSWKSRNGRYINLGVNILTGKIDGDDVVHKVGVVCDTLMLSDDGGKHLHLRLFHDQGGAPEYYTSRNYLSIPLKRNPYHLGTGDTISVVVNTYEGPICRQFVY